MRAEIPIFNVRLIKRLPIRPEIARMRAVTTFQDCAQGVSSCARAQDSGSVAPTLGKTAGAAAVPVAVVAAMVATLATASTGAALGSASGSNAAGGGRDIG